MGCGAEPWLASGCLGDTPGIGPGPWQAPQAAAGSPPREGRDQAWRWGCGAGRPGRRQGLGPRGEQAWGWGAPADLSIGAAVCVSWARGTVARAPGAGRRRWGSLGSCVTVLPGLAEASARPGAASGVRQPRCAWHVSSGFALSRGSVWLPQQHLLPTCSRLPSHLVPALRLPPLCGPKSPWGQTSFHGEGL